MTDGVKHVRCVINGKDAMIPKQVVCILLGVSASTFYEWLKGDDPPPYDKKTQCSPARDLAKWMREKQILRKDRHGFNKWLAPGLSLSGGLPSATGGISDKGNKIDYNKERARKEKEQADKIAMENDVQRGLLVHIEDVEKGWGEILSRVKTRLMQIPYSAAMIVVGDNDMTSVQTKLKDMVRDVLLELSASPVDEDEDD